MAPAEYWDLGGWGEEDGLGKEEGVWWECEMLSYEGWGMLSHCGRSLLMKKMVKKKKRLMMMMTKTTWMISKVVDDNPSRIERRGVILLFREVLWEE